MFLPLKISVHFLLQMQFSHSINSISDFHCSFTYIINAILCFEHYTFHFMCHLSCRIFSSVLSLVLPLQNLFQLLATSNAAFFSIACISDFHSSFYLHNKSSFATFAAVSVIHTLFGTSIRHLHSSCYFVHSHNLFNKD